MSLMALSIANYNSNPCCDDDGIPVQSMPSNTLCLSHRFVQKQPEGVISTLRVLYGIIAPAVSAIALVCKELFSHFSTFHRHADLRIQVPFDQGARAAQQTDSSRQESVCSMLHT